MPRHPEAGVRAAALRSFGDLFVRAFKGWSADSAPSMGAALAFYTLFSMAPLLVLVIAIAGLAIGHDAARQLVMAQVSGLLGATGAQGVQSVLDATSTHKDSMIATAVSLATLALGATTVFAELRDDLDRIWHCDAPRGGGIWSVVRARFLSFGMVAAIGFLLLVSLVVSAALSYLGDLMGGGGQAAMQAAELVVSVAVTTGLFAITFKMLPTARIAWGDVWLGSFVTAVLFSIGKSLIGLYIGKSAVASSYGAAGTLVVVIVWVYYSAQIFFYGAEFTREFARRSGSHRTPQAANSEFAREDEAMVARARRIVKGKDPALSRPEASP